jgi:U3 small nucleolar RNA-associated protein 11
MPFSGARTASERSPSSAAASGSSRNTRSDANQPQPSRGRALTSFQDYSLRAKDYNKKKEQLKNLAQKAADRNPDEFYFGMMSREGPGQRVKEGKHHTGMVKGDRGNKAMSVDLVRLLKTQDVGYVRTMRQVAAKEVRRLEEQVVLTRGLDRLDEPEDEEMGDGSDEDDFGFDLPSKPNPARKIVFIDDEDQRDEVLDQIEDERDDEEEFDGFEDKPKTEEQSQRDEDVRRLRKKLESAKKKLQVLTDAERELEEQRAKMAKTATSGGSTSSGKKIKVRTRKR